MKILEPSFYTVRLPNKGYTFNITYSFVIIPVTRRVKGFTRFVRKYVTGRRKRFDPIKYMSNYVLVPLERSAFRSAHRRRSTDRFLSKGTRQILRSRQRSCASCHTFCSAAQASVLTAPCEASSRETMILQRCKT